MRRIALGAEIRNMIGEKEGSMEIGLVLVGYMDRPLSEALDVTLAHGITVVEPCGGGHFPDTHYSPDRLAKDPQALRSFAREFEVRGIRIAAFACHGNPLHPDGGRRTTSRKSFEATCQIASELGVTKVDVLSGVPGGGPQDRVPNWIINSIFPDFQKAYEWQWNEQLIPYWTEAAVTAEKHGVTICMEPHGGDMVYDTDTFLRLRNVIGPTLRINVDPSHLFWLGIDPLRMVSDLGPGMVGYATVKDVVFRKDEIARNGLLPGCNYADWDKRSWTYRALGYGHPEEFWRQFVSALRLAGYDEELAIEIEDPYLTRDDAVRVSLDMMRRVMPRDPQPAGNWFDAYEWRAADIE